MKYLDFSKMFSVSRIIDWEKTYLLTWQSYMLIWWKFEHTFLKLKWKCWEKLKSLINQMQSQIYVHFKSLQIFLKLFIIFVDHNKENLVLITFSVFVTHDTYIHTIYPVHWTSRLLSFH